VELRQEVGFARTTLFYEPDCQREQRTKLTGSFCFYLQYSVAKLQVLVWPFCAAAVSLLNYYFTPAAKYCVLFSSQCVCLSVCLFVHSHVSRSAYTNFTKFSIHVACGHGSPDDITVHIYFRFCRWCFHIMGPMVCGIASINMGTVLQQIVINFQT